jgi:hypothetical protein
MGLLSRVILQEEGDVTKKVASSLKSSNGGGLLDQITRYHRGNALFYGAVFEAPSVRQNGKRADRFFEDVTALIGTLGSVIDLPARRVLVLFSHSLDREAIIHRISKSLGAATADSFEADDPDTAFKRIQDYL